MTGSEQLDRLRRELDEVDARAAALAARVDDVTWKTRPAPNAWSPSECVQHLVLSAEAMTARLDPAIDDARSRGVLGDGPYRPGWIGRLLLWSLEPPYRMRAKTGAAFVAPGARSSADDIAALRTAHDAVRTSLDRARGLALDRLTMASPFFENARYNLYAGFATIAVHGRRHLWQAEQAVKG